MFRKRSPTTISQAFAIRNYAPDVRLSRSRLASTELSPTTERDCSTMRRAAGGAADDRRRSDRMP